MCVGAWVYQLNASMRPRLFTAEDALAGEFAMLGDRASMRPRLFTAEDVVDTPSVRAVEGCFNEAAAIHRGRPSNAGITSSRMAGFNEAAAIHRGRQRCALLETRRISRLQ